MAYRYKATSDGTLSDPYRFVKKGDIVDSDTPIKASWLVLAKGFREPPVLPVMPFLNLAGNRRQSVAVAPAAQSDEYKAQMEAVINNERKADGKEPLAPAAADTLTGGNDSTKAGTGNQDVI